MGSDPSDQDSIDPNLMDQDQLVLKSSQNGRHMDQPACSMESYERLSEDDSSLTLLLEIQRLCGFRKAHHKSDSLSLSSNMTSHKKASLAKPQIIEWRYGFNVSKVRSWPGTTFRIKEKSVAQPLISNHSDLTGPNKRKTPTRRCLLLPLSPIEIQESGAHGFTFRKESERDNEREDLGT
ncbi:MAG: hypothetical protein IPL83_07885 [Bdellovibrionales bacterium]|nr:hypothetical protein [Bdellovibrionales bacterium]